MSREDDVLYGFLDALPQPLRACCSVERIPPQTPACRTRLLELLRQAELPRTQWRPPRTAAVPGPRDECQTFVELVHGQIRVRLRGRGGVPLLMLH